MTFARRICALFFLCLLPFTVTTSASAQDTSQSRYGADTAITDFAARLSERARMAAYKSGESDVQAIACDPGGFKCTCQGAFDCAWLSWFCAQAGGIQGFDDECYLPSNDPETVSITAQFRLVTGVLPTEATCDGIFCTCQGPASSDDCNKIKACADDFTCIGDSCTCIGGHTD